MIERITVLGGSSVYTPELIQSLVSHNLNVKEVVLVGRSGPKLSIVARFCQRMVARTGFPLAIHHTTDLEAGIRGARYVVNAIRVGGMPARARDEKIPPQFGMLGDETLGAGGIANALRTLPVVFDIARIIESVNPQAILINLSNPLGIIIEALGRYTKVNAIGVCDLPALTVKRIAEVLRCPPGEIAVDYVGINHFGWVQDVKIDGRSYLTYLLDKLARSRQDGFDHELIGLFRMIPTRTAGLFYHQLEYLKKQHNHEPVRAEILHEAEQQILRSYQDEHLHEIPELVRERDAAWYEEGIVPLIEALESKSGRCMVLCVRNGETIRDFPEESSIEASVWVGRKEWCTKPIGSCPRFMRGLCIAVKESDRLIIEAVRHKSYECAMQALAIHPLVPSVRTAKKFLDYLAKEDGLELH